MHAMKVGRVAVLVVGVIAWSPSRGLSANTADPSTVLALGVPMLFAFVIGAPAGSPLAAEAAR